jgi:CheY-like chemotaxis protein
MTTVLVCDDEPVLRGLIRATLDADGHSLVEAEDGEQALQLARSVRPDIILLDLMMPGRTGIEVLEELRRDPQLGTTPVVMLTARAQAADRDAAERAGADGFLPKPFSPRELVRVVEELLGE